MDDSSNSKTRKLHALSQGLMQLTTTHVAGALRAEPEDTQVALDALALMAASILAGVKIKAGASVCDLALERFVAQIKTSVVSIEDHARDDLLTGGQLH